MMLRLLRWLLMLAATLALWVAGTHLPPYQVRPLGWECLTCEQQRIVTLVATQGLSSKEIAREMGVSENAVKKALTRVYGKLNIGAWASHKRPVLIRWAWGAAPDWEVSE